MRRIVAIAQHILHVGQVDCSVSVIIFDFRQFYSVRFSAAVRYRFAVAKQRQLRERYGRRVVTRRNQFLQFQEIEIHREILEKVAFIRVVAITQHRFTLEMLSVMFQLVLDVGKLRVKLVVLVLSRRLQRLVRHSHTSLSLVL